jgi:hypothetical protein
MFYFIIIIIVKVGPYNHRFTILYLVTKFSFISVGLLFSILGLLQSYALLQ